MVEEEKRERKAFPDWFIIKREILWSFFRATNLLGEVYRARRVKSRNEKAELNFEEEVVALFYKTRNLIRSDKTFKKLLEIEDVYILKNVNLGFKKALEFYKLETKLIDKKGILDIEMNIEEDLGF